MCVTAEAGGKSLLSSGEEALPRHLPTARPSPAPARARLFTPFGSWTRVLGSPPAAALAGTPALRSQAPLLPFLPLLLLFLLGAARRVPKARQGPDLPAPPRSPARGRAPRTRALAYPRAPPDTRVRAASTRPWARARAASTCLWTRARAHIQAHLDTRARAPRALEPPAPPRPRRALPDLELRVGEAALLGDWREPGPPGGRRPHHGLSPSARRDSVPPGSAAAPVRHARRHTRARTRADTHVRSAPSPDGGARLSVVPRSLKVQEEAVLTKSKTNDS